MREAGAGQNQNVLAALRQNPALSLLALGEQEALAERMKAVHYSLGQEVCRAGDPGDAFFLVVEGKARVVAERRPGEEASLAVLEPGQSFGEKSLLTSAPRSHTVRAAGNLTLMRLGAEDFRGLVQDRPEIGRVFESFVAETSVLNLLRLSTVFSSLPALDLRALLGKLRTVRYGADQAIFSQGDPADAFFLLRSGTVRVTQDGNLIRHLQAGDGFGEMALLTGEPRSASVISNEPVEALKLSKEDFDEIVVHSDSVRRTFLSIMAGYGDTALGLPEEKVAEQAAEIEEELAPSEAVPQGGRKFPIMLQPSETDCGATCLAMILKHFGKRVSIRALREIANVGRSGATMQSLAHAAEDLGFRSRGVRSKSELLDDLPLPAIVHWQGFHYTVLYRREKNHVEMADPAVGRTRLTRQQFAEGWTGYALLLEPTIRLHTVKESPTTLARFLPMLKPYRKLLGEILIASFVLQLLALATPMFTQLIVDKVLAAKNVELLNIAFFGLMIIAVFQGLTSIVRQYLVIHTARRIDIAMASAFFGHVLKLPVRFFAERKVGDLLKRFNENAKIRDLVASRALGGVLDVVMVLVYSALMIAYSPKLAAAALTMLPLYVLLATTATPMLRRISREVFQKEAEAESHLVEAMNGIQTLKASAGELPFRWKWEHLAVRGANEHFRLGLTQATVQALARLLEAAITGVILWYGARLVLVDELSIGQLMAFYALVFGLTRALLNLVDLWDGLQESVVALERLSDVFETAPEEDPEGRRLRLPSLRGHIRLENITFRYPGAEGRPALSNVSLEIQPGQMVALVGRSGAGKSTFANLLLRMYPASEGRVFVDGYDIRHLDLHALRRHIGVVPQEVHLFSGTIRENIALGQPDAPLESVIAAGMLAGAHDFVSELPLGYETVIGERGQSLSGGQRQRISIARALFRKPSVLIFDEATSALDTESERAIQRNLETILRDRTTLVIAHRLSTVRNADLIVVMDRGTVVEVGRHAELLERQGLYAHMVRQQLEE